MKHHFLPWFRFLVKKKISKDLIQKLEKKDTEEVLDFAAGEESVKCLRRDGHGD